LVEELIMSNIKSLIIFISIGAIIILGYVFFFKGNNPATPNLTTSASSGTTATPSVAAGDSAGGEFLTLLLNVKNIKLNDAIFTDPAFTSLKDSSIVLNPDGTEGRPNPFAPIGADTTPSSITTTTSTTNTTNTTTPQTGASSTSSSTTSKTPPPKN
jgi:hypothetical protein